MKVDRETKAVQTEGQLMRLLIEGDSWPLAKGKLMSKVLDLQSIRNIDDKQDATAVVMDIRARNTAAEILIEWLREVEGIADQHKSNTPLIKEEEDYVIREE